LSFVGQRNQIGAVDKFEQNVISKKEIGHDVRDLEKRCHDLIESQPPRMRIKKEPNVKDKFLYERWGF
jgi:hypothetical protein